MSKGDQTDGSNLPAVSHGGRGFSIDIAGVPIPLRRTFGAIDRLIATPIEALADVMEKKIKRNLDSHVDDVQKKRKTRGKKETIKDPSVKTTKRIAEWAAAASEVEPEEHELSAIWRSVLDEILDGEEEAEELLHLVKTASSADIRFFLRRFNFRYSHPASILAMSLDDTGVLDRLRNYGLIRRPISVSLIWLCFGFGAFLTLLGSNEPQIFGGLFRIDGLRPAFLATVGVSMLICLLVILNWHMPTYFGRRLGELYREYYEDRGNIGRSKSGN